MTSPHDSADANPHADAAHASQNGEPAQELDPIAQLQADLAAAQAQVSEQRDQVLRAHAEMENVRRRAQEEVSKARKFGIESFATSQKVGSIQDFYSK